MSQGRRPTRGRSRGRKSHTPPPFMPGPHQGSLPLSPPPRSSAVIDTVQRSFFQLRVEAELRGRSGTAFQDFVADIMEYRFPNDFMRVTPWGKKGDLKCDGYLLSARKLFQVYAPMKAEEKKTIAKILADFDGAQIHWRSHYDVWVFVENSTGGSPPGVAQALLDLPSRKRPKGAPAGYPPVNVERWNHKTILQLAMELNGLQLEALVGPAYTMEDVLQVTLPDLLPILDLVARLPAPAEDTIRPVSVHKLQGNRLSELVLVLLRAGMARADLVGRGLVAQPDPMVGDRIAAAFKARYQVLKATQLNPDDIFSQLLHFAGGGSGMVPTKAAALAVVAHFFEECDIFEDPAAP
jgi:hypothetical protein